MNMKEPVSMIMLRNQAELGITLVALGIHITVASGV